MSIDQAQIALIEQLNDNLFGDYHTRHIKYPNSPFTEPDNRSWLRLTTTIEPSLNVESGGGYQRTYGIFVIDCFYPKDTGSKKQMSDVKQLISIYNNVELNAVKCQEAYAQVIGEDGDWYNVQVNINFYFEG